MRFTLFALAFLLSGPAAHARLNALPSSVNFYGVEVGTYGQQDSVTIYNWSNQEVRLSVSDFCYGDFQTTNWCFSSLRPNGSCRIDVRFSPRSVGYQSCSIWVRGDQGSSLHIGVSGQGVDNY